MTSLKIPIYSDDNKTPYIMDLKNKARSLGDCFDVCSVFTKLECGLKLA